MKLTPYGMVMNAFPTTITFIYFIA